LDITRDTEPWNQRHPADAQYLAHHPHANKPVPLRRPSVRFAPIVHSAEPQSHRPANVPNSGLKPVSFYNPVSMVAPSARSLPKSGPPPPVPAPRSAPAPRSRASSMSHRPLPSQLAQELQKEREAPQQYYQSANRQRAVSMQQAAAGPGPRTVAQRRVAEAGMVVERIEGSYDPNAVYPDQQAYEFAAHGIRHI
jgi:hypothetical protein